MDTLGKYKTNFLGNKNSFNIGFNNRSPFSYKSSMPTNFISVPTVSANPGDYILSGKTNYASFGSGEELTRNLINIGKALGKKLKNKKDNENKEFVDIVKDLPDFYSKWEKENPSKGPEDFKKEYPGTFEAWSSNPKNKGITV